MKEKLEGSVAWVWKFWGRPEDAGQRKNRRKKEGSGELSEWALSVSIAVREVGRGGGRKCERSSAGMRLGRWARETTPYH